MNPSFYFRLLLAFLPLVTQFSFSQNEENNVQEIPQLEQKEEKKEKTRMGKIWEQLWGVPAESSVIAMPFGLHTDLERFSGREHPNGLHPALYFSANYKSIDFAGFKNSFGDFSCALTYKRMWTFNKIKNFSMNVGAGLIWGYDGRLQHSRNVPFRNTFLIKGDVMPVIGGQFDYIIYKKLSLAVSVAPAIIIYGLRYRIAL